MNREIGEYDIRVVLEPEVSWVDIVPVVEELQNRSGGLSIRVERAGMRPSAGGPGYDIVPIAATFFFGALVAEAVRDVVYPFLKDRLRTIYEKVSRAERAIELKPLGVAFAEGELTVTYRFPHGLSDTEFASALQSIPVHFVQAKGITTSTLGDEGMGCPYLPGKGALVYDFDADSGNWMLNEEACAFLTWAGRRAKEGSEA